MFCGCCCASAGGMEVPAPEPVVVEAATEAPPAVVAMEEPPAPAPPPEEPAKKEEPPSPEPVEEAAPEEEKPVVKTFECALRKGPPGKLGMRVDLWSFCIQVVGLEDDNNSAVKSHNSASSEDKQVLVNDFITRVNGISEPEKMTMKLAMSQEEVTLQIAKPTRFRVIVSKDSDGKDSLGLRLIYQKLSSTCIHVVEVLPGMVQRYNEGAVEDARVRGNDFIEAVNGVSESAAKMLEELKKAKTLEMVFLRLPPST